MNDIQKLTKYIVPLLTVSMFVLIILNAASCFLTDESFQNLKLYNLVQKSGLGINPIDIQWTLASKIVNLIGSMILLLPTLLTMFTLRTILLNYQNNDIFSLENIRKYRFIGKCFFWNGLAIKPFGDMIVVWATTMNMGIGNRTISLSFGTENITYIFYGVFALILSYVMTEGAKISEESKLTI